MKTVLSAPPVAPVPTSMRKLLHQVETALSGLPELDTEFENTFRSVPPNVTRSIDAAARLIETELPGWWWNCGHCALRNGASLYVPGSSQIRVNFPSAGIGPAFVRLLQDPSGVSSSTAASIVIAPVRLRLRCWPFSLRPRSP